MSTEAPSNIVERIRKLLALAADAAASPNEAATAARQAEALMRKYNVEHADVIQQQLKDKTGLTAAWVRATTRKNAPRVNDDTPLWAQIIATDTARLFDCHCNRGRIHLKVKMGEGVCSVIMFYGYKTDVEVCVWTYEYLLDCVRRLADQFEKQADELTTWGKTTKRKAMDSFRYGCATAICRSLVETRRAKEEADRKSSTSTALVISKRTAVEAQYGQFDYGDADEEAADPDAISFSIGMSKGKTVNVNPHALDNKEK